MPVKRHFLFLFFVLVILASYSAVKFALNTKHNQRPLVSKSVKLPSLSFYGKSGEKLTLEDFSGKVVLVNLWATWCPPCVAELPSLDRLQAQMPPDQFKVVAISVDRTSMEVVEKFLQDTAITSLDPYWDQERQVPLKWTYDGLPTSFLLDRQGVIVAQYNGPYEWDKEPLLQGIRDQLAK